MITTMLFILAILIGYGALKLKQLIKIADRVRLMRRRGENKSDIDNYINYSLVRWVPYLLRPILLVDSQ